MKTTKYTFERNSGHFASRCVFDVFVTAEDLLKGGAQIAWVLAVERANRIGAHSMISLKLIREEVIVDV